MAWPQSHDFQDAVLNPESSFRDDDLRSAAVVKDPRGLPIPAAGQFGIVYQMVGDKGRRWAVKCFTADIPGRGDRYRKIAAHLRATDLPFMVGFDYLEQGVFIKGAWYPVLKMDWVEGQTLNRFIGDRLDQPGILKVLTEMWPRVARGLRDAAVTHADLQHGNVMLVPGKAENRVSLKLVDYDGMYLPSLAGTQSGESGHPGYQHPRRLTEGLYGAEVDRFSNLVIYTALRAIQARGRELWPIYNHGDNLLFSQADFQAPRQSKVLHELWQQGPDDVRAMTGRLVLAVEQPLEQIPQLDEVTDGSGIRPLTQEQVRAVGRALGGASEPRAVTVVATAGSAKTDPAKPKTQPRIVLPPPSKGTQPSLPPVPSTAASRSLAPWLAAALGVMLLFVVVLGAGGYGLYRLFRTPPPEVTVQTLPQLSKHTAAVTSLAFSRNGELLASAGRDKVVFLWDPASGELRSELSHDKAKAWDPEAGEFRAGLAQDWGPINSLAMNFDGSRLVFAGDDKFVRAWDTTERNQVGKLKAVADRISLSDDGRLVACLVGTSVKLWDRSGEAALATVGEHGSGAVALAIDARGERIVSAGEHGLVRLHDISGKPPIMLTGLRNRINAVVFSPDGEQIAAAGQDFKVMLWKWRDPKTPDVLHGHTDFVKALAYSGDGTVLATAGEDKTICLWDPATAKLLTTITLDEPASCVSLGSDGRMLAAGVGKAVRRWLVSYPGDPKPSPVGPIGGPPSDGPAPPEYPPDKIPEKTPDKLSPDKLPAPSEWIDTQFGDWSIFAKRDLRKGESPSVFLYDRKSNQVIQLVSDVAGWMYHRDPKGDWRIVRPSGESDPQTIGQESVARYFETPRPTAAPKRGEHTYANWKVTVEDDRIVFRGNAENAPADLVIYRDNSALFTYGNESYGPSLAEAKSPPKIDPPPKESTQSGWINTRFGEWSIFPLDTDPTQVMIVSTTTHQAIWIPKGLLVWQHTSGNQWRSIPEKGKPLTVTGDFLNIDRYFKLPAPAVATPEGSYSYGKGTVLVTEGFLEIRPSNTQLISLILTRKADQFAYAGRSFGPAGNEIGGPAEVPIGKGPDDPPDKKPAKGKDKLTLTEKRKLEGTWSVGQTRFTFKNGKFTQESFGKTVFSGTYEIRTDLSPHGLDVTPTDGPDKGKLLETIYRFNGNDRLELIAPKARPARPTELAAGQFLDLQREGTMPANKGGGTVLWTKSGRIGSPGKIEYWDVRLEAGKNYVFEMKQAANSLIDPCLELRDGRNNFLADDPGVGNNAIIFFSPLQTGNYRIRSAANFGTTGSFTLTLTRE